MIFNLRGLHAFHRSTRETGKVSADLQPSPRPAGNATLGKIKEKIRLGSLLGEPDMKKTIERREVWFYRVDIGIAGGMDVIPVSFDETGRSMYGMVRGDTHSAMAKEEDL